MQNVKLPITLDPYKAAQKRLDYSGIFPRQSAVRLAEAVTSVDTDIRASLSFSIDMQGLTVIAGQAEVEVTLTCQRCNQPFKQTIHVSLNCCPVKTEAQIERLPEEYEPVEVNELNEVDLLAFIEDDLLLSLPIVPVHDSEHCEVSEVEFVFGELPEEEQKPNPFAILTNLKQK